MTLAKGNHPVAEILSSLVIGQDRAVSAILPYIEMYDAGLNPVDRPAGVFLLLGPTGTGKTRTVEAVAEALHGSPKKLVSIACGEFQMEHEVAKLIGAPPGYLGHSETPAALAQDRLASATSAESDLTVVLFDEIEKAAGSMTRLLLGVLDKATLRLGNGKTVVFEKTLIFMTSNLGARKMSQATAPALGFASPGATGVTSKRLGRIGMAAAKRKFSPEFMNRVDEILTYETLTSADMSRILDLQLGEIQAHINRKLGPKACRVEVPAPARKWLVERGSSAEYGARELKRCLQQNVVRQIAALLTARKLAPGDTVTFRVQGDALRAKTSS